MWASGSCDGDPAVEELASEAAPVEAVGQFGEDAYDGIVARLTTARTPRDYARLATPVLDEVDSLERAFAR